MASKQYTGECQCGVVRYEVTVDLDHTITCNCSRCGRLGAILTFAPAKAFRLLSGEHAQTEYRFNKMTIQHLFSSTCGIESFACGASPDGTEMVAVNDRCLGGVDPAALSPQAVDGCRF